MVHFKFSKSLLFRTSFYAKLNKPSILHTRGRAPRLKEGMGGFETRISSAHNCENISNFENRSSVVRKEFNCLTNNMSNNMDFKNGSEGMILNFKNESSVVRE